MDPAAANTTWARAFVGALARAGVREACIAPGSRSTPLVMALARHDGIRTFVHLDERSAAFFALGIGKASGRPAAVVSTSGTAVANLLPAVVEARWSGAPLLLLTADRPRTLRGTDANQTIEQPGIFGRYPLLAHDVETPSDGEGALRYVRELARRATAAALGLPAGPVHLNFPFAKPLEPPGVGSGATPSGGGAEGTPASGSGGEAGGPGTTEGEGLPPRRIPTPSPEALDELAGAVREAGRGILVCGPSADPLRTGPLALALARALGWPLLADPLSGARFGPGAPRTAPGAYDLFLRNGDLRERLAPELVLRLGPAPTSATLLGCLEEWNGARQTVVDAGPRWPDHGRTADRVVRADPGETCRLLLGAMDRDPRAEEAPGVGRGPGGAGEGWLGAWRSAEEAARAALDEELGGEFFEGAAAAAAAAAVPAGGLLFAGSSMPVRDLDAFGEPRPEEVLVIGNRGASGIDGSVSTAAGAVASGRGPGIALLGDLAFLHDLGGLHAASRIDPDLALVVVDNDGGGIFQMLPIREHEPEFTEFFATPHGLDLSRAAELYGVDHRRARSREELESALARALGEGGLRIVEVPSDREANRRRREEVVGAVARAAGERPLIR